MGVKTGRTGSVTISTTGGGAAVLNVFQWTAPWIREKFKSTTFTDDVDGNKYAAGMYDMTITLSGFLDGTTVFPSALYISEGSECTFSLLDATGGSTYSGSGLIEEWAPTVHRQDGLNAYSCKIASSGDVAAA